MLKQIKKMLDSLQTAKAQQAGGGVEWRGVEGEEGVSGWAFHPAEL